MEGAVNLIYRAFLLMTENHRHWNTQKVRLKKRSSETTTNCSQLERLIISQYIYAFHEKHYICIL